MLRPKDYGLPFDKFRPHQHETAWRTVAAFQRRAKLVLVQAPTGLGKTSLGPLVADMLEVNIVYTCHTKNLQTQFMKDFGGLGAEELTGRRNYPCLKGPQLFPRLSAELCTVKSPNCKTCALSESGCRPDDKGHCPCITQCPYRIQKERTQRAPIGVLNVPYYLREANFAGGFDGKDLVVLDEVDETEEALMSLIEVTVPDALMTRYGMPRPELKGKPEDWKEWAPRALEIVKLRLSKLQQGLWGVDHLLAEHQLTRLKTRLEFFISEVDNKWVFDGKSTFKPIWVSKYGERYLWSRARRFLGMSATIGPWRQLCHDLGISTADVEFIDVPCVFPVESRLVHYQPAANMNHNCKEAEFPSLVKALDKILENHGKEKGVVHGGSYYNVNRVLELTKHPDRIVTHKEFDRESQLARFVNSSLPLVLLSPSMERGVNLPYDKCRFIVIIKVPYPYLGDPQVSARLYRGKSAGRAWYEATTARSIVQATGRGMRAPDDFCVSYILDAAFGDFYSRKSSRCSRGGGASH